MLRAARGFDGAGEKEGAENQESRDEVWRRQGGGGGARRACSRVLWRVSNKKKRGNAAGPRSAAARTARHARQEADHDEITALVQLAAPFSGRTPPGVFSVAALTNC